MAGAELELVPVARLGVEPDVTQEPPQQEGDNNAEQKKRKLKWAAPYSNITVEDANKRLGVRIDELPVIPVETMLVEAKHSHPILKKVRKRVYHHIVGLIDVEGYPTEANPNFKEANISDLVCTIIVPIITGFKRTTGRNSLWLERERLIISTDSETGGYEEFFMVDRVSVTEERFVFIVEAKKASLGLAMRQCLLSMKDMRDNNCGGEVYGFVTTGKQWQMIRYDGTSFVATEEFTVLFQTMGTNKKRWMKDYSVVVDCMYVALSKGGIMEKRNKGV